METFGNLTVLSSTYPAETADIFYPDAKAEAAACLPLLDQLRRTGLTCILVEMPFHMAIFDINAAEDMMAQFQEVKYRYLADYSIGGAMAARYAADHPEQVEDSFCWEHTSMGTIRPGIA